MRLSDRITGSVLIALGAASAYGGSLLPPVPGQQIGPNVFPIVVGLGLVLCGGLIAARVGQSFEAEAAIEEGPATATEAAPPRSAWWVLLPPALLLFYAYASERLGFFLTAAIILMVSALSFRAPPRLAIPLALIAPVAIHLIFAKLLRVPLPPGLVPMPW